MFVYRSALRLLSLPFLFGALCALASCGDKTVTTSATLSNANGQMVGTVSFSQTGATPVKVSISVTGLAAGQHGVHVHDVGKCEGPEFTSAGGHFNPTAMNHGDPQGATHHTGDLGNLTVAADGTGALSQDSSSMSLDSANVGYIVGHAFIVHATMDDLMTQPTGDSGARIACGVIPAPNQ